MDQLEALMKAGKYDEAAELLPECSKFWTVLTEADQDFIHCARLAIEEGLPWNPPKSSGGAE
jgi:hypothetical protein